MDREDDAQLWDLLGHSRVAEASPFFARNCVRAVRNEPVSGAGTIASWFSLRRLVPTFATVAALVIAAFVFHNLHDHGPANRPPTVALASVDVPDAELVATDLDVLSGEDDSDDPPLL
jgi:hypothetical protein